MGADYIAGFTTGFSLILAIGAQNAFVLKHGLQRRHVFWICLTCALSDALLIAAGVAGAGALVAATPWLGNVMRYGGAAFLLWYGARNLRSARRGGAAIELSAEQITPLGRTLAIALALTWLNPHVYLDTVMLIGGLSAQAEIPRQFGMGAITASFVFFFGLGYGAAYLAPLFARPRAWQVLDAGIGLVMWALALKLIVM